MAHEETDETILAAIKRLEDEEQQHRSRPELDEKGRSRLAAIRVELDQQWDLLRQRRARREFGEDPAGAHLRPGAVVEGYEQ